MTVEVVLDTNIIVSISRKPTAPPNDKVSAAVEKKRVRIVVDAPGGIQGEWEKTANREVVQQLIIHWHQFQGWRLVPSIRGLPRKATTALRRMGFKDTIDKLVIRTAYSTLDKRVATNDPDFWDPKDRDSFGKKNAPVAKLCREQLATRVSTLAELVAEFS